MDDKQKRWTWDDAKVESLLFNLESYKNDKAFEGVDFEADLITMYVDLRKMMALMYPPSDFGDVDIQTEDTTSFSKQELIIYKRKIDRKLKAKQDGYTRVKNKIKELRRGYKKAIDTGTRSGSGRLVKENFDILQEIWGGSPSVTSLPSGLSSLPGADQQSAGIDDEESGVEEDSPLKSIPIKDTKKRNHMVKKISAHQREMIMIDLAKKEIDIKEKTAEALHQSIDSTERAIRAMTESMTSIGNGIKEGLALLASSFSQNNHPTFPYPPVYNMSPATPTNHNTYFQHPTKKNYLYLVTLRP